MIFSEFDADIEKLVGKKEVVMAKDKSNISSKNIDSSVSRIETVHASQEISRTENKLLKELESQFNHVPLINQASA